jgi:hypothetical protein
MKYNIEVNQISWSANRLGQLRGEGVEAFGGRAYPEA